MEWICSSCRAMIPESQVPGKPGLIMCEHCGAAGMMPKYLFRERQLQALLDDAAETMQWLEELEVRHGWLKGAAHTRRWLQEYERLKP